MPEGTLLSGGVGLPEGTLLSGGVGLPDGTVLRGEVGLPDGTLLRGEVGLPEGTVLRGEVGLPEGTLPSEGVVFGAAVFGAAIPCGTPRAGDERVVLCATALIGSAHAAANAMMLLNRVFMRFLTWVEIE